MCSICLEEGELDKVLSECSHSFHSGCIRRWYETNIMAKCPVCRGYIDKYDIYPKITKVSFDSILNSKDSIGLLMNNRNFIYYKTITGDNLLILSCKDKNIPLVKFLLEEGVDVNDKNDCGNTALMWACFVGSMELVKILFEKGADINHRNNCGYSGFMWACKNGWLDIVKYLFDKDCDISSDRYNIKVLSKRNPEIVKFLLSLE